MYKFLSMAVVLAGMAAAMAANGADGPNRKGALVIEPSEDALTDGEMYRVAGPDADAACVVGRGAKVTPLAHRLVKAGCIAAPATLGRAERWIDGKDGQIVFADISGTPVLVFATADGVAYEAIEPASSMLVLEPARRAE